MVKNIILIIIYQNHNKIIQNNFVISNIVIKRALNQIDHLIAPRWLVA